uniref:Uncharacterized protein n=1 Tax=Caenorhabditis japonica TaxID=281687 RepID=A0A8R1E5M6_CAEJA
VKAIIQEKQSMDKTIEGFVGRQFYGKRRLDLRTNTSTPKRPAHQHIDSDSDLIRLFTKWQK